MTSAQIVGIALILAACLDALTGFFVVAPRLASSGGRRILLLTLGTSAAAMLAFGVALLMGAIG